MNAIFNIETEILPTKSEKEIQDERVEKLKNDPVVKYIMEVWKGKGRCDSLWLTGGAVIDILEGREPKDYDFLCGSPMHSENLKRALSLGLIYGYSSTKAVTFFTKDGKMVQVLRTHKEDFPFTIEQSSFSIRNGTLTICEASFKSKKLIPNHDLAMSGKLSLERFKCRKNKWESKGYSMHPITNTSYTNYIKRQRKSVFRTIKEAIFGTGEHKGS